MSLNKSPEERISMTLAGFIWNPSGAGLPGWKHEATGVTIARTPQMRDTDWTRERCLAIIKARALQREREDHDTQNHGKKKR